MTFPRPLPTSPLATSPLAKAKRQWMAYGWTDAADDVAAAVGSALMARVC